MKKIYEIKSRSEIKALPVLAYSLDIVKQITSIDKFTEKIIKKYWPGPLTLILKLTDEKLKKSLNLENKIAVRIPDSKCTLKLLEKCGLLVGTSANISGDSSYTNPDDCLKNIKNYFKIGLDILMDFGWSRATPGATPAGEDIVTPSFGVGFLGPY